MLPIVNKKKCTGCDKCIEFCPVEAIIRKDGKAFITIECVECGACIEECPEGAISFEEEETELIGY
jgi:ferredoxin